MPKAREVFVLVWNDSVEMTVEAHATEESALDSASGFAYGDGEKFTDAEALNTFMEERGRIGGIYPRKIAGDDSYEVCDDCDCGGYDCRRPESVE